MEVRYGEGLAVHTDPGSCAGTREGIGEALTGARTGGVSSGVSDIFWGADVVAACRRQQGGARNRKGLNYPASSLDPLTGLDTKRPSPNFVHCDAAIGCYEGSELIFSAV